jgi:hypothetical protein
MYLRLFDYKPSMQDKPLTALEQGDTNVRLFSERYAEEYIKARLAQKYDFGFEFSDTNIFSLSTKYNAFNRTYLDFPLYDPSLSYPTIGTPTAIATGTNQGQYISTVAIDTPETFNPAHWKKIGLLNDMFYIQFPYPLFSLTGIYKVGDRVIFKNKIYQCQQASRGYDHQSFLDAIEYANLGFPNFYPDAPTAGLRQWGVGTDYNVNTSSYGLKIYPNSLPTDFSTWTAGTYASGQVLNYGGVIVVSLQSNNKEPLTDITSWQSITWISGDNRCQEILKGYVDISLWRMAPAMAPQNIPSYLQKDFEMFTGVMEDGTKKDGWIDMAKRGDIIPNLITANPSYNGVYYGGTTKQNNNY